MKTIRKTRLYKFIWVPYSQPLSVILRKSLQYTNKTWYLPCWQHQPHAWKPWVYTSKPSIKYSWSNKKLFRTLQSMLPWRVGCRYHFSHRTVRYSELLWYCICYHEEWGAGTIIEPSDILNFFGIAFGHQLLHWALQLCFALRDWWVSPTVMIHIYELQWHFTNPLIYY